MRVIRYIKLFNHLINEEGLRPYEAVSSIKRVREMDKEILSALYEWMDGNDCPDIVVNNVSFADLTNNEDMKPVRAFLMLDWVKRDPIEAMSYMKERLGHAPVPRPDSATEEYLDRIIENIQDEDLNKLKSEFMITEDEARKGDDIVIK